MGTPEARRPGRPRSERARRAVLTAVLELAAEAGTAGLHMEAIARRAGVSKETLYRWWPTKTEVILDALAERGRETIPLPDTGNLRKDLRTFLRSTVDSADWPTRQLLHAIAATSAAEEAIALEVRDRFIETRRAALGQLLKRGVVRGEISAKHAAIAVDLIYGSLWYRLIFCVGPIDYKWADRVAGFISPERQRGGGRS